MLISYGSPPLLDCLAEHATSIACIPFHTSPAILTAMCVTLKLIKPTIVFAALPWLLALGLLCNEYSLIFLHCTHCKYQTGIQANQHSKQDQLLKALQFVVFLSLHYMQVLCPHSIVSQQAFLYPGYYERYRICCKVYSLIYSQSNVQYTNYVMGY